ncbi:acetate--CoA ligase family protein [Streptomyces sp. NPDC057307]|uniref:acetate--CoA ligase family protein n=1 Tax=Streptomyces sp. NPDC057307 TaxID=3346096 RepID=UPI00362D3380
MYSSYGLMFPTAVTGARHTGYPLALKVRGSAHRTEAGGIALDLRDEAALRSAFARMSATNGSVSYAVEAMVRTPTRPRPPCSRELIVGVRRDASFRPVVMVGTGGVTAGHHGGAGTPHPRPPEATAAPPARRPATDLGAPAQAVQAVATDARRRVAISSGRPKRPISAFAGNSPADPLFSG